VKAYKKAVLRRGLNIEKSIKRFRAHAMQNRILTIEKSEILLRSDKGEKRGQGF